MIKVSVIIPVYNVELYLRECLDSIINQTLKEIEIICIDDCSSDNSYSILEEYLQKDNRIKILKNDYNKGAGQTRNIGIDLSNGEYIYFMDSDDCISLDFLENLFYTAKEYDVDLVSTLNIMYIKNGLIEEHSKFYKEVINRAPIKGKSNVSIINLKRDTEEYIHVLPVNKILRKKFIIDNNLKFSCINSRIEDVNFTGRVLCHFPSTAYNHKAIYYYKYRANSTTNLSNFSLENNIKAIEQAYDLINYYKNNNKDLVKYVYKISWGSLYYLFKTFHNKEEFYPYIYNFAQSIYIEEDTINHNSKSEIDIYKGYNFVRLNSQYYDYLSFMYIVNNQEQMLNNLYKKLNVLNSNNFRLFGIQNLEDRLVIILFGIKVTFKKRAEQSSRIL